MRNRWVVTGVLLGSVAAARADVDVRLVEGKVDLHARSAPLSEILDRLGRLTGMKVVYEGPPPRQSLTVTLQDRTPAEAVLTLLDGAGLNYAMLMDKTGTQVQQLLMAGSAPMASSRPSAPAPRFPVVRQPRVEEVDEPDEALADEPVDAGEGEDRVPVPGALPGLVPGQDIPFNPGIQPGQPGMPTGMPTPSPGLLGPGIRPLVIPTPPPQEEQPVPAPGASPRPPS
jgi:hypothetical protein